MRRKRKLRRRHTRMGEEEEKGLGLVIPKGCDRLDVDGGVRQVMGREP